MNLLIALAIGCLVAAGAFLMLERDLFRILLGTVLMSNAAILFIMTAGLARGPAPIHPLEGVPVVSDPLVQALSVTAVVINFAVTALLAVLILRVFHTHQTMNLEEIAHIEEEAELREERPSGSEAG